jgi:DNA mismatch repair protein MutL
MTSRIRRLSQGTVNRIAAGEVIERPASAVKELVENAIDAGASQIDVAFRDGGKSLIRVVDDGVGMAAEELALAVERHATSKIPDDDLTSIATLGFRGEALPSIGSVARMSITSVARGSTDAHAIQLEGGETAGVRPAALARGTTIDVRDLFYATPARLKFLKTDRSETTEALDVVRRLALAHPDTGFSFASEERQWLSAPAGEGRAARVSRIMGAEFMANAVPVAAHDQDVLIEGFAGLPTYSRTQGTLQYAVVNGRPVKDKLIMGAIRGAYVDVMPRGRFPAVVLFITTDAQRVDVNVHPAKTEVRFRDPGFVRALIVSAIRRALAAQPVTADAAATRATVSSFRPVEPSAGFAPRPWSMPRAQQDANFSEDSQAAFEMNMPLETAVVSHVEDGEHPLGTARAQLHGNYIVAQTATGMILVDQHAAHERIVYERLKQERAGRGIVTQPLLVPDVIDLDAQTHATILSVAELLAQGGLVLDSFGDQSVIVREVPAALSGGSIPALLHDIADDAQALEKITTIDERLNHVLATFACHHSVRSGRALRAEEMNALLREMEVTPNAGQCNHGRPTFIELKLADIERLFGR